MAKPTTAWGETLSEYSRPCDAIRDLPEGWKLMGYYEQSTTNGLEVIAFDSGGRQPTMESLRSVHKAQQNERATPLLVVTFFQASGETQAKACGPEGVKTKIWSIFSEDAFEKAAGKALGKSNHLDAIRYLKAMLPRLGTELPGVHNAGLFATHELKRGVPFRKDWSRANADGQQHLNKRGKDLIEALGFTVAQIDTNLLLLTVGEHQKAIAVFLKENESYEMAESQLSRFSRSPVSDALAAADNHNVQWVIIARASELRLYATKTDTGVGGGSRTGKYLELDLDLLPDDQAGYLPLLFSAKAMEEHGSLDEVVVNSSKFATELASRLRDRVYDETIPALGKAIAEKISANPSEEDLSDAYQQAMLVLFRLLFLAYGEAQKLLPINNEVYSDHSITRVAQRMLRRIADGKPEYGDQQTSLWREFKLLCEAIDEGQPAWGVPPYNGGLFSRDASVNANGAALDLMPDLADRDFGSALKALLIDVTDDGQERKGLVDFRELSVREFGTIYEGLLESRLAVAKTDLAIKQVKKQDLYVPAKSGDDVVVKAGEVYLRNQSGARKSAGSYFTKAFAVDHILQHSLAPALKDHLKRVENTLKSEGETVAARVLFDFRCADIAMGSGHFLVAALDMIAERFTTFLGEHDLPSVEEELERLLRRALEELGEVEEGEDFDIDEVGVEISREMLLRRQIARHCIYGVDLHEVAVELAKVALWVHTFVPGLPLTLFNHNLRLGDSLTGMCDVEEARKTLGFEGESGKGSLFIEQLEEIVSRGAHASAELGNIHVDTVAGIAQAREAEREAEAIMEPVRQLFDLATAKRAGVDDAIVKGKFDEQAIWEAWHSTEVQAAINEFSPLHFQVAFPEVFNANRQGFDCLVGNPPWDEVKVDRHIWWGLRFPGLRSLPDIEMNKRIDLLELEHNDLKREYANEVEEMKNYRAMLRNGKFDLGAGDTDLYKAFVWRFLQLSREEGHVGVILPRTAVQAVGLKKLRAEIINNFCFLDVTTLENANGWVFADVTPKYTVALCSIRKGFSDIGVPVGETYNSLETYLAGSNADKYFVPRDEFFEWSSIAAFPSVPLGALGVFRKMKQAKSKTNGGGVVECSPHPRSLTELHQTMDKPLFTQNQSESLTRQTIRSVSPQ